jgi:hypothetical protein
MTNKIMTVDEAIELSEIVGEIPPRYLAYESLHPQKKPRGSIRRRRKQNENTTSQSI